MANGLILATYRPHFSLCEWDAHCFSAIWNKAAVAEWAGLLQINPPQSPGNALGALP